MTEESREIRAARKIIQDRLDRLDEEQKALDQAYNAIANIGRPPSRTPALDIPKPRRRKRARKGQRKEQFLAALKAKPGSTVAQVAKEINVSPPNPLYALAKRLTKEGLVVKDGSGYKLNG